MRFLKKKAVELNLPYLKRKWNKIDDTFVSRKETAKVNKEFVFNYLKEGKFPTEISKILNLSKNAVYQIIYRNKEENWMYSKIKGRWVSDLVFQ